MTTRTRTVLRWLLIANLVFVVVGGAALVWLSQTESGRRAAADAIARIIDDEIPGRMTIGRIERFGSPTIVHKMQIRDPEGALVIEVDRAAIDFDLSRAFEGVFAFHGARVQGGRVFIAIAPSGRTTLEEALSAKTPEPDPNPHGGLHFSFRNIEVEGVHLTFKGSPDDAYRVRGIRGKLDIFRENTVGARILMHKLSGEVQEKLAGMPIRLVSVTAWVHGAERQVLNLHALTRVGGASMKAHVRYYDRDKTPVEIVLSRTDGLEADVAAMLVYLQSLTTDDLEVTLGDA